MTLDWKNIASRAAWTFVQTFIAVLVGTQITDWTTAKQAVVSAATAGLASVLSFVKTLAQEILASLKPEPEA